MTKDQAYNKAKKLLDKHFYEYGMTYELRLVDEIAEALSVNSEGILCTDIEEHKKLEIQNKIMREALEVYAKHDTWSSSTKGELARKTLKQITEVEK